MKERPILFSGPMVRAILSGQKTQTRRAVKCETFRRTSGTFDYNWDAKTGQHLWLLDEEYKPCPYGQPGDRLWIREAWNQFDGWQGYFYRADDNSFGIGEFDDPDHIPEHALKWKPSIHMPRAACRLVLEIVSVRVEQLHAISRGDAMAEGCPFPNMANGDNPIQWFSGLWESINGPESWAANPWVWVVEFRKVAS